MERVAFLITTYNRSDACRALAEKLIELGDVFILDDCSDQDYQWANKKLELNKYWSPQYMRLPEHAGKKLYFNAVTNLWQLVMPHASNYKYFIMLPDDFIPEPNFLKKSIQTWQAITDPRKICLNLYTEKSRLNSPCWTGVEPEIFSEARRTQWVDMCFLAEAKFFENFQWTCPQPNKRWSEDANLSSGVGATISQQLHQQNWGMWQTHTSMFSPAPESHTSKMNPRRNESENENLHQIVSGIITAQIASLPERVDALAKTVESLRPQVDRIFVALNDYPRTPDFLNEGEYIHLDNSTGDAAKFYNVENLNGYLLTCDDDLIYPPDYVQFMIRNLHAYSAIVSLAGKIYPRPVTHFRGFILQVHCLADAEQDVHVDVAGTGVMCLHTDMIKLNYSDFKSPNMADLWMAKLAKEQYVPVVALHHRKEYLTYQEPRYTIYEESLKRNFVEQNRLLAEIFN